MDEGNILQMAEQQDGRHLGLDMSSGLLTLKLISEREIKFYLI